MTDFPQITWITNGSTDYRPAIAADGTTVVFERAAQPNQPVLYMVVIGSGKEAQAFLPSLTGTQTRPDWCWKTNEIAFNVQLSAVEPPNNPIEIFTVDGSGAGAASVAGTAHYSYPQWDANGDTLTVMNNAASATPDPCTTVIGLSGGVLQPNVNGNDSAGVAVFGGMPAVNPSNAHLVAFAGQTAPSGAKYNQVRNYIYLNQLSGSVYSSGPMEPGAPIDKFDPAFQGRAPAWSPNGRYVVFESDRASKNGGYALFLFDTQSQSAAVQLTDPAANPAQHAKFYPDGKQLIFCAQRSGHGGCIGSIDISQYVS